MSRNISARGLLMIAGTKLAVGSTLEVTFRVGKDASDQKVSARIVRFEANESDPTGIWPYRAAVEFEEPHPELELLLKEAGSELVPGAATPWP